MMDIIIQRVSPAWTFRILGFLTLAIGLPAAWLIKERSPVRNATFIEWYATIPKSAIHSVSAFYL